MLLETKEKGAKKMEWNHDNSDCLGDGVYAMFDGFGIWLHANDHQNPTDKIYLEPEVLAGLNRFIDRMKQIHKKEQPK